MPIPGGYSMVELKGLDLDKPTGTITEHSFKKLHDAKDPVIVYGMNFNGKDIPPSYMTIETREDGEIIGVFGRYLLFFNMTDVTIQKIEGGGEIPIYQVIDLEGLNIALNSFTSTEKAKILQALNAVGLVTMTNFNVGDENYINNVLLIVANQNDVKIGYLPFGKFVYVGGEINYIPNNEGEALMYGL